MFSRKRRSGPMPCCKPAPTNALAQPVRRNSSACSLKPPDVRCLPETLNPARLSPESHCPQLWSRFDTAALPPTTWLSTLIFLARTCRREKLCPRISARRAHQGADGGQVSLMSTIHTEETTPKTTRWATCLSSATAVTTHSVAASSNVGSQCPGGVLPGP